MVKMRTDEGFTIVEVVVTLLFISIISLGILTMHTQVSILSIINRQDQKASYLAYDNMRKYVNGAPPTWFLCTDPLPGAVQQVLLDSEGHISELPGTTKQKVVASAPYGCGDTVNSLGMPIRVESVVTYGNGKRITHVAYAAF